MPPTVVLSCPGCRSMFVKHIAHDIYECQACGEPILECELGREEATEETVAALVAEAEQENERRTL